MIGWFYSVSWRVSGVTRGGQKILEGGKTILDTSNRFRVVTDVVCDDFMHSLRPLGAERVPSRLAAPPRVPWKVIEQRGVSSVMRVAPGIQSGTFLVVKSKGKILVTKSTLTFFCLGRRDEARRGAARREGTRKTPRGLSHCIKSSYTTSVTTLKRLEVSTIVLVVSKFFGSLS